MLSVSPDVDGWRDNATMRVSHSSQRRLMCSMTTSLAHHSGSGLTDVRYYEAASIQSSNLEKCFDTARMVGYQKFFLPVLYCRCRRTESPQDTFEIFPQEMRMKSSIVKRSVVIDGHKTSVSLEDQFWSGLKEIAHAQEATLSKLVAKIDETRQHGNLSSAIRLFVLDRARANWNTNVALAPACIDNHQNAISLESCDLSHS
jgi:predicted DNA-binding ribbon-helix-helix protein